MSCPNCCPEPSSSRFSAAARRIADLTGTALPGIGLLLMPKCPACLAAYVALGTGLGISFTAATYLRTGLIVLCIASLAYFGTRQLRRAVARMSTSRRR